MVAPGHCVDIDGDWWHAPGSCTTCRPACCTPADYGTDGADTDELAADGPAADGLADPDLCAHRDGFHYQPALDAFVCLHCPATSAGR